MMLMQRKNADVRCKRANSQPKMIIQRMLRRRLPSPVPASIRFPKGKRPKLPILKHCKPKGIPTMVMQSKSPAMLQANQDQNPAKRNHIIFPSVRIYFPTFYLSSYPNINVQKNQAPAGASLTTGRVQLDLLRPFLC